ncbi:MAG: hypothetical protein ACOYJF_00120 [Prevotella sp.]|jgi:hypothetical protein
MSEKRKSQRSKREEEQRKQGDKIVKWIFAALIIMAIIYMLYTFSIVQ